VAPPVERPATNGLFNAPEETDAPEQPADDPLNDLFGEPEAAATPRRPQLPLAPVVPSNLGEVFAATRIGPVTARPAATTLTVRGWLDESGAFGVTGRLVKVSDGRVQILKTNNRTCTIAIVQLSARDQDYVRRLGSRNAEGQRLQSVTD
jgi:hypothetical protein